MLVIAIIQYKSINSMMITSKRVDFTYSSMEKDNKLIKLLVDMETGERGFLMVGDEKYLEPYYNGKDEFAEVMASLKEQLVINPEQLARLKQIEKLERAWHQKAATPEIELRKSVNADSTKKMHHVVLAVQKDIGKNIMDDVRGRIKEVIEAERALLMGRAKENE